MIWQYNPKKKELFVPEPSIVIPNVKTLDDARNIMNPEFNPVDWTYIVKSKTSKVYNFANLQSAEDLAKAKSKRNTIWTVFQHGKAVVSFMNEKELTKWTTVWERRHSRPTLNEFYYRYPKGEHVVGGYDFSESIDVAEDKVRYTKVYIHLTKTKNGHLSTKFTRSSKVFHKDGSVHCHAEGRINHVSARDIWLWLPSDGEEIFRAELIKLRPEIKELISEERLVNLPAVFSRPTAYYKFDTFHKKFVRREENLYYGYYPKEVVDESKMIDVLRKRMRIPCTKGLRKLYNESHYNMDVVHWLKSVGFKDVNSFQKLVAIGVHFCLHNPDKFKNFFKKFIELRGENNVARMTCDTDFALIKDVARSYMTVNEDAAEFVLKKARGFEEIHETFNRTCPTKSELIETPIKYTEKEVERFNLKCDNDIRFELASSNKDLAIVGAEMGICVGGYADIALSKRATIVKMMKGNKHIACIEVNGNQLVQLKAKFNNPVEREYKKYIDKWLVHSKTNSGCHDYQCIGKAWHSTHNYAHVRPVDYQPATHTPVLQIIKADHTHYDHVNRWFARNDNYMYRIRYDTRAEAELRAQENIFDLDYEDPFRF